MTNPESTIPDEAQLEPGSELGKVQSYWNERIHDLEMTAHEPGTKDFFQDLDDYRFDKLRYLPRVVNFNGFREKKLLEVGCGIGTDLVRFASGGARCVGVDLSRTALDLAQKNAQHSGVRVDFHLANGEALPFDDDSFDVVYGHGVLQYTVDPKKMIKECRRVLRRDGEAIFMVYNRISWLNALSKLMKVGLEHEDAPVLRKYSIGEYRSLVSPFSQIEIVPERFPVRSRLHKGWKGFAFNHFFVDPFNALPRSFVRRFGWHLMAFCRP